MRASVDNPYKLYQKLTGLATPAGSGSGNPTPSTPVANPQAEELIAKRKSVNDTIRAELSSLLQNPKLSAADKQRLQQHFDAIRDTEKTITEMGSQMATVGCTLDGIDTSAYQALSSWKYNATNVPTGGIENIVELHMGLVALAFACDFNRTGTLQWGDGTDHTVYQVPSNKTLGNWNLHYISHRTQSDGATGSNATAETAHAEIDQLRMATLAKSLKHFADRGLQNNAIVVWTNHVAEGNHTMKNVPFILWGNGGGLLKRRANTWTQPARATHNCSTPSSPPPRATRARTSARAAARTLPRSRCSRTRELYVELLMESKLQARPQRATAMIAASAPT